MKRSMSTRNSVLLYISLSMILSCQQSAQKMNVNKDEANNAVQKKEIKKENPNRITADTKTVTPEKSDVTKWNAIASKAQIKFGIKGPFGTVHGSLEGLKSTILFDADNLPGSSIRASVDPKTISTGIGMRNRHLQKETYFNSDLFSSIAFRSEKIQQTSSGYKATGKLTLKGISRTVEIPFHFAQNGNNGVFKCIFTINRKDFNVGKDGGSVGNTINIDLEVPVTK